MLGRTITKWREQMQCSVIVPTWNEEAWLPRLLHTLDGHPHVREIIIADNGSTDGTVELAKQFGCRVVNGGRPAKGRNNGARQSRSEFLVFLDADVLVSHEALTRALELLCDSDIDVVHFRLSPLTARRFVKLCYWVMDKYLANLSHTRLAQGVGCFLAVKSDVHFKLNGFREDIGVGEDADYVRRAASIGNVRYDRSQLVTVSGRRFELENPFFFASKVLLWSVLRLTPLRWSLLQYKWKPYPDHIANSESDLLGSNPSPSSER